jgi:NAD-dependent deacetylase
MFGQPMPVDVCEEADSLAREADVFLAIGSSLVVQPAASLPRVAKSCRAWLAIINREATPLDSSADLVVRTPIGEALEEIGRRVSG